MNVVGDRCVGAPDEVMADRARRLARAAGVDLLAVVFRGSGAAATVVDAHSWTDPYDDELNAAILDYFDSRCPR